MKKLNAKDNEEEFVICKRVRKRKMVVKELVEEAPRRRLREEGLRGGKGSVITRQLGHDMKRFKRSGNS